MLRPEAWVLAGLYWLWVAWRASWRQRALYAALAALGPLVWTATDFIVTGDPLFSLLYTSGSAEDLGRQRTLAELPTAIPGFLNLIVKLPILLAAAGRPAARGRAGAAARGDAARAARLRRGDVRADRRRRRVGDRALPGDRGGRAARLRRRVPRRLHDAAARAAAHVVDGRRGRARDLRRRLHGDARAARLLRLRADVPRRRARRPRARARVARRPGRACAAAR